MSSGQVDFGVGVGVGAVASGAAGDVPHSEPVPVGAAQSLSQLLSGISTPLPGAIV